MGKEIQDMASIYDNSLHLQFNACAIIQMNAIKWNERFKVLRRLQEIPW